MFAWIIALCSATTPLQRCEIAPLTYPTRAICRRAERSHSPRPARCVRLRVDAE